MDKEKQTRTAEMLESAQHRYEHFHDSSYALPIIHFDRVWFKEVDIGHVSTSTDGTTTQPLRFSVIPGSQNKETYLWQVKNKDNAGCLGLTTEDIVSHLFARLSKEESEAPLFVLFNYKLEDYLINLPPSKKADKGGKKGKTTSAVKKNATKKEDSATEGQESNNQSAQSTGNAQSKSKDGKTPSGSGADERNAAGEAESPSDQPKPADVKPSVEDDNLTAADDDKLEDTDESKLADDKDDISKRADNKPDSADDITEDVISDTTSAQSPSQAKTKAAPTEHDWKKRFAELDNQAKIKVRKHIFPKPGDFQVASLNRGELDVLVISRKYGLIICETKSMADRRNSQKYPLSSPEAASVGSQVERQASKRHDSEGKIAETTASTTEKDLSQSTAAKAAAACSKETASSLRGNNKCGDENTCNKILLSGTVREESDASAKEVGMQKESSSAKIERKSDSRDDLNLSEYEIVYHSMVLEASETAVAESESTATEESGEEENDVKLAAAESQSDLNAAASKSGLTADKTTPTSKTTDDMDDKSKATGDNHETTDKSQIADANDESNKADDTAVEERENKNSNETEEETQQTTDSTMKVSATDLDQELFEELKTYDTLPDAPTNTDGNNTHENNEIQRWKADFKRTILKALTQLKKNELVLTYLTSDLPDFLKVTKILALPCWSKDVLAEYFRENPDLLQVALECFKVTSLEDVLKHCLCSEQAGTELGPAKSVKDNRCQDPEPEEKEDAFLSWWTELTGGGQGRNSPTELSWDTYDQLIARFCGKYSKIEGHSVADCINLTGIKFGRSIVTEEQLPILRCSDPFVYLSGPPGSGKTLLMGIKAVEWVKEGYQVYIICCEKVNTGSLVSWQLYRCVREALGWTEKEETDVKKKSGTPTASDAAKGTQTTDAANATPATSDQDKQPEVNSVGAESNKMGETKTTREAKKSKTAAITTSRPPPSTAAATTISAERVEEGKGKAKPKTKKHTAKGKNVTVSVATITSGELANTCNAAGSQKPKDAKGKGAKPKHQKPRDGGETDETCPKVPHEDLEVKKSTEEAKTGGKMEAINTKCTQPSTDQDRAERKQGQTKNGGKDEKPETSNKDGERKSTGDKENAKTKKPKAKKGPQGQKHRAEPCLADSVHLETISRETNFGDFISKVLKDNRGKGIRFIFDEVQREVTEESQLDRLKGGVHRLRQVLETYQEVSEILEASQNDCNLEKTEDVGKDEKCMHDPALHSQNKNEHLKDEDSLKEAKKEIESPCTPSKLASENQKENSKPPELSLNEVANQRCEEHFQMMKKFLSFMAIRLTTLQPQGEAGPRLMHTEDWKRLLQQLREEYQKLVSCCDELHALVVQKVGKGEIDFTLIDELLQKAVVYMKTSMGFQFHAYNLLLFFQADTLFRSLRELSQQQTADVSVWCSSIYPSYRPEGFTVQQLTRCVRCPPVIQEIMSMTVDSLKNPPECRYALRGKGRSQDREPPYPVDGPNVKFFDHGPHMTSSTSEITDCEACGDALAHYLLQELKIDPRPKPTKVYSKKRQDELKIEDVIITGSLILQSQCRFAQALRNRGIDIQFENPELKTAPPYPNKLLVLGGTTLQGLEAKIVIYIPEVGRIKFVNKTLEPLKNQTPSADAKPAVERANQQQTDTVSTGDTVSPGDTISTGAANSPTSKQGTAATAQQDGATKQKGDVSNQNGDVSDQTQKSDVSDQAQKSDVTDQAQNSNVTDQTQKSEVGNQKSDLSHQKSDVSEPTQKSDDSDKNQKSDVSQRESDSSNNKMDVSSRSDDVRRGTDVSDQEKNVNKSGQTSAETSKPTAGQNSLGEIASDTIPGAAASSPGNDVRDDVRDDVTEGDDVDEDDMEGCMVLPEDQQKLMRLGGWNREFIWSAASRSLSQLVIFHI